MAVLAVWCPQGDITLRFIYSAKGNGVLQSSGPVEERDKGVLRNQAFWHWAHVNIHTGSPGPGIQWYHWTGDFYSPAGPNTINHIFRHIYSKVYDQRIDAPIQETTICLQSWYFSTALNATLAFIKLFQKYVVVRLFDDPAAKLNPICFICGINSITFEILCFCWKPAKIVRIKTLKNCSMCAQVKMVDQNGSYKHSKVTVHRQSWTMEIKKLCGGKNPKAINRLDHTIQCVGYKSIPISPAFLLLFGLWKCGAKSLCWYFYLF